MRQSETGVTKRKTHFERKFEVQSTTITDFYFELFDKNDATQGLLAFIGLSS
jgi:hypothetical protein